MIDARICSWCQNEKFLGLELDSLLFSLPLSLCLEFCPFLARKAGLLRDIHVWTSFRLTESFALPMSLPTLPPNFKSEPVALSLSLFLEKEDEPAPLQIFDPRCSGNKLLRCSPRLPPQSPPEVNAAQTIGKKNASMASKQPKPLRSSPRLSSASKTRNAVLESLNARAFRRSPRLNSTPDPNPDSFPGTLPGSSRKSDSLKGRGSLENSKSSMFHENSPSRSPRFTSTQNGKAELSFEKVRSSSLVIFNFRSILS